MIFLVSPNGLPSNFCHGTFPEPSKVWQWHHPNLSPNVASHVAFDLFPRNRRNRRRSSPHPQASWSGKVKMNSYKNKGPVSNKMPFKELVFGEIYFFQVCLIATYVENLNWTTSGQYPQHKFVDIFGSPQWWITVVNYLSFRRISPQLHPWKLTFWTPKKRRFGRWWYYL